MPVEKEKLQINQVVEVLNNCPAKNPVVFAGEIGLVQFVYSELEIEVFFGAGRVHRLHPDDLKLSSLD